MKNSPIFLLHRKEIYGEGYKASLMTISPSLSDALLFSFRSRALSAP
jgi:hypothetical protein